MFQKSFKYLLLTIFVLSLYIPSPSALASTVGIYTAVGVADATSFSSTAGYKPGEGKCELTWILSKTPNITSQQIYIDSGGAITAVSVLPPGSSVELTGLAVGWPYVIRHVSEADTLESSGVWTGCTPTSNLPAPVMTAEPATTEGTTNTVFWDNGGIDEPNLECRVGVSTTTLNAPPFTYVDQSTWAPCPSSTETYEYTFNGLSYNTTYFYHVQSRTIADGLSPFSNVVYSTQIDTTTGGGTYTPPSGGGGVAGGSVPTPTPVCGNFAVESGEQCDDGNTVSGDGCSSTCDIEHEAAEEQECGNGVVETGEQCDDGNYVNGDGCNSACQLEEEEAEEPEEPEVLPVCGNGSVEDGEQCDDGNLTNGDGCNEVCELEAVTVTFEIKGTPEFRVPQQTHPNLSLNSEFLVYKPSIANLDSVRIKLDDFGNATYEGEIVTGTYDFGLNGEAHNTKIIRGINITPETELVTLDFTYADTVKLTAGDTVDNNYINGVDMSKLIQQYRMQGTEVLSDLNKEGYVNGIDASIIITNYRKTGEAF